DDAQQSGAIACRVGDSKLAAPFVGRRSASEKNRALRTNPLSSVAANAETQIRTHALMSIKAALHSRRCRWLKALTHAARTCLAPARRTGVRSCFSPIRCSSPLQQ